MSPRVAARQVPAVRDAVVMPSGWPQDAVVRTARLRVEPVRVAHAEAMAEVLADPSLYEVIGGAPPTVAELESRYRRWERPSSDDGREGWLNWVVLRDADDVAVGAVQATTTAGANGTTAELAWVVGVPHQGHGYATEAVTGVIAWLVERGVRDVRAHIAPDHLASEAVARRIGLRATGILREDGEQRWRLHPSPAPPRN
ncbi:GNAT family N-acetyltransferase [Saccharothrix hoggarensis]|uniref:GNAT family N-acetyltransferase n=1 Tax=Saccharothrix hoggarensis TaxID=913853 RepID=A0ABW3R2R3_9PSEU